jgi:transposase
MPVTVLSVSDAELGRLEAMRDVDHGRLPVRAAAQLLGRSERQVWRLLKAFRAEGAAGLISKKRGRPSNRKTAKAVRSAVLWIVRQNYADFGPTLAAEKLAEEHGFSCSRPPGKKLVQFRVPYRGRRSSAALRWGSAPARRPTPAH